MYKHLYDCFSHWYHGGTIYFYSDPHFNDDEMKHLRKNYIGDDEQVRCINSKVGKNDTLIILGDVGDVEFVKKLRGYKVLIMGNHDSGATNYKRKKILINNGCQCPKCNSDVVFLRDTDNNDAWCNTCKKWVMPFEVKYDDNYLFDEVYEGPLMIAEKIILSHEPVNLPFALNIHGHDHSNWNKSAYGINVCAEHINYTPIPIKSIVESGVLKQIPSIHRITIDTATARKKR